MYIIPSDRKIKIRVLLLLMKKDFFLSVPLIKLLTRGREHHYQLINVEVSTVWMNEFFIQTLVPHSFCTEALKCLIVYVTE